MVDGSLKVCVSGGQSALCVGTVPCLGYICGSHYTAKPFLAPMTPSVVKSDEW